MLNRENFELWCKYGVSCGKKYMLVVAEGESKTYFPVFAKDEIDLADKTQEYGESDLQCIVGKFDLEGDYEDDIDYFFKAVKTVDATAAFHRLLEEIDKLRDVGLLTSIANRLVKVLEDCKSNEAYSVLDELADFEAIAKDAREIIKRKEKYD